jgi:fumarylpyruvate hydrolase
MAQKRLRIDGRSDGVQPPLVQTAAVLSNSREAMTYVIAPPPVAALPIAGSDKFFPVHRIYCVGRNYAEHAREMGHDPDREPPFFFQKNPGNVRSDGKFPYPSKSRNVPFEIELVVALKSGGVEIEPEHALEHVYGYAVGLDMTRRDLQAEMKRLGRPWEVAKAFEHSAPCTPIVPADQIGHPTKGAIWLDVNGERRQTGDLGDMIWDVPGQIRYLSGLWELKAGDLIFTGTPAGVGAVEKGDRLKGHIDGVGDLEVTVI